MTSFDLTHDTVVFLGPSLPLVQARSTLDAMFLPPARMGDVFALLPLGPKRIVLLDGVFHGSRSVWPREIVTAIDAGVEVFGAASMGALRAAELHTLGMVGVGQIYEWYKTGALEGDDEVALRHGDAESGYRAMSEPLVNIRATLIAARMASLITVDEESTLLRFAKGQYYPDRSLRGLLRAPALEGWSMSRRQLLKDHLLHQAVPLKSLDAIAALKLAASAPPSSRPTQLPTVRDESLWVDSRHEYTWVEHAGTRLRGCDLGETILAHAEDGPRARRRLVAAHFLHDLARRKGWETPFPAPGETGVVQTSQWLLARGARACLPGIESACVQEDADASAFSTALDADDRRARPFLLAWAEEAGAVCPEDEVIAMTARVREGSPPLPEYTDATPPAALSKRIRAEATVEWILRMGPEYFGIAWLPTVAAFVEFQMSANRGRAVMRREL